MFGEEKVRVAVSSGEYADVDLIECSQDGMASTTQMFQAQYVKYGPVVYQYNSPEELGAALFAIDPESSHDGVLLYKEEEARRLARTKGTLEPSDPVPAPDALTEPPPVVREEDEDDVKFFREQEQQEASSTPEVLGEATEPTELPIIDAGLPEVVEPVALPTSTPPVIEEVPVEVVLPVEEVPAVDLSSTTPE